jgi:hypothetical protein
MRLTTQQIRQIIYILLQYLEEKKCKVIQFTDEDSWYQKIFHERRHLNTDPAIALGFLGEDIEELQKIFEIPIPCPYELERLGIILTTFGAVLATKISKEAVVSPPQLTTTDIMHVLDGKESKKDTVVNAHKLTTKKVARIMDFLLKSMEGRGYDTLYFSNEDSWYQKVRLADRDLEKTPYIFVGSVEEDMKELAKLLTGESKPSPYDFERLGAVLMTWGAVVSMKKSYFNQDNLPDDPENLH